MNTLEYILKTGQEKKNKKKERHLYFYLYPKINSKCNDPFHNTHIYTHPYILLMTVILTQMNLLSLLHLSFAPIPLSLI